MTYERMGLAAASGIGAGAVFAVVTESIGWGIGLGMAMGIAMGMALESRGSDE